MKNQALLFPGSFINAELQKAQRQKRHQHHPRSPQAVGWGQHFAIRNQRPPCPDLVRPDLPTLQTLDPLFTTLFFIEAGSSLASRCLGTGGQPVGTLAPVWSFLGSKREASQLLGALHHRPVRRNLGKTAVAPPSTLRQWVPVWPLDWYPPGESEVCLR